MFVNLKKKELCGEANKVLSKVSYAWKQNKHILQELKRKKLQGQKWKNAKLREQKLYLGLINIIGWWKNILKFYEISQGYLAYVE